MRFNRPFHEFLAANTGTGGSQPEVSQSPEQLCADLQAFVERVASPELRRLAQERLAAVLAPTHTTEAGTYVLDDNFLPVIELRQWLTREPDDVAIELAEADIFEQLKDQSQKLHAQGAEAHPQWVPPHRQLYQRYLALRKQYGILLEHDMTGEKIISFLKTEGWLDRKE